MAESRFVADVMLGRLARWLRALGYDTLYFRDAPDRQLLALALSLDPVYVGAHHLTRIFFVSLTMPLLARYSASTQKTSGDATKRPIKPPPFQD